MEHFMWVINPVEEHEKIQLRSEEVQEILGTPPNWIVRWGSSIALLVVLSLLSLGWIVQYPDIVPAEITITTNNPPMPVIARSTGYISQILVKENQPVSQGEVVMVLQSSAKYEDILKLDKQIQGISDRNNSYSTFVLDKNLQLGELQSDYSNFIQSYEDYSFKVTKRYDIATIGQLQDQIANIKKTIQVEKDKEATAQISLSISKNHFNDKRNLYLQEAISRQELEQAKEEELHHEDEVKNIHLNILAKEGEIKKLNERILSIQQGNTEDVSTKKVKLNETIGQMRSKIDQWKQNYILVAPIEGLVSFNNQVWSERQNVKVNDEVFSIVPGNSEKMIGKMQLPINGSGKVLEGQRVIIQFANYPYEQFGTVDGRIEKKSLLPNNDKMYSILVSFPNGLQTSLKKELHFDQQMQGTAKIITENRRFVDRIFDKLIASFKNH